MGATHRSFTLRAGLVVLAAIGLVAAGGGIAYATGGSSGEEITACAKQGDGLLRVVEAGTDCKASESSISWPARAPPATGRSSARRPRRTSR